ncbi:hypothetical protein BJ138DRAFT_1148041 [Hygrophoropsis aurantiaca]|uniref:Uncharacterized protein n=1 Tax=Hygrophoropsis aurantiaca TaxID=72124 RepID=A0ACB8AHW4_9AGAM|nr:hypothetical protein BJ138DRAFT_1148041 [Hygrophoropsis aurantiaca]
MNVRDLLGAHPAADSISSYLGSLTSLVDIPNSSLPEVKSYSDAVYFNYYALGLSFLFSPQNGYKPTTGLKHDQLKNDHLILDSIDIYNIPKINPSVNSSSKSASRTADLVFATHPASPLKLYPLPQEGKERLAEIEILRETTGKDFVVWLGEPDRKGGGTGPSSGSIGIWCEWSKDGIMVEFGGDESRGPQAWERGKDATWKVITVFPSKDT